MSELDLKKHNQIRRVVRNRNRTVGTSERPRLSVDISNRHISAQIIDDIKRKTLVAATTVGKKSDKKTTTERAELIGAEIAKKAKTAKIKKVVFDRGSRLYHGRMKALADAARKEGLEF